jgi:rhamnosyltransferase
MPADGARHSASWIASFEATGGERMIERGRICAVVVTHFPGLACADNLRALSTQVAKILVVDNGSSPESFDRLAGVLRELDAAVIRMGRNAGIAAALNAGLAYARQEGYSWLATFDQDSVVTPGMIAEMAAASRAHPHMDHIAILSPLYADLGSGLVVRQRGRRGRDPMWRTLVTTMSSGNLVWIEAAFAAGGWEERLFIDYVDHEFCLRLRRLGWQIVEARCARLHHSLGLSAVHRLMGVPVSVTNHSSARRYYISRNRVIMWRRYWRAEFRWCLLDFRGFLRETCGILLFEQDRLQKIAMTVRGMIDAFRSRKGPLEGPP